MSKYDVIKKKIDNTGASRFGNRLPPFSCVFLNKLLNAPLNCITCEKLLTNRGIERDVILSASDTQVWHQLGVGSVDVQLW